MLILNADGVAAEFIGDPEGGDVHLALLVNLLIGEFGFFILAGVEVQAFGVEPLAHGFRFGIAEWSACVRPARTG